MRIAFMVDQDGEVSVTNGHSLREDQEEMWKGNGDEGFVIAHIEFRTEDVSELETAGLQAILAIHELEIGSQSCISTLEKICNEIFKAGVEHGRRL